MKTGEPRFATEPHGPSKAIWVASARQAEQVPKTMVPRIFHTEYGPPVVRPFFQARPVLREQIDEWLSEELGWTPEQIVSAEVSVHGPWHDRPGTGEDSDWFRPRPVAGRYQQSREALPRQVYQHDFNTWLEEHGLARLVPEDGKRRSLESRVALAVQQGANAYEVRRLREEWEAWNWQCS